MTRVVGLDFDLVSWARSLFIYILCVCSFTSQFIPVIVACIFVGVFALCDTLPVC
jgi:hypothetical protein